MLVEYQTAITQSVVVMGGGSLTRYNTSVALGQQSVVNSDTGSEYTSGVQQGLVVDINSLFPYNRIFTGY